MDNKIILQKKVYLHSQRRQETEEVYPVTNWRDWILQSILTEDQVTVNYNFKRKDYEFYPEYKTNSKSARHICGWSGLRKMFPFVYDDYNVECLVTIIVSSKKYVNKNYLVDKYNKPDANFHAEGTFFIVDIGNGFMMSKDKDKLFYEIDDGYVKWDVSDRKNGALIYDCHPLYDMIPEPEERDEHGELIPYEAKIIVDAYI